MRSESVSHHKARRRAGPGRSKPSRMMWNSQSAGPLATLHLARLRLSRNAALLGVVGLGIVLAVVLMCTVPLYTTLIGDIQLHQAIAASGPIATNVQVNAHSDEISQQLHVDASTTMSTLEQRYLDPIVHRPSLSYATSDEMLQVGAGATTYDPARSSTPHVRLYGVDMGGIASGIQLSAGTLPVASGSAQALISLDMANQEHLQPGDTISITEFGTHTQRLTLTVSGIYSSQLHQDSFWNGLDLRPGMSSGAALYPVLISKQVFFHQLPAFRSVGMDQRWVYYTDAADINLNNMSAVGQQLDDFQSQVNGNLVTIAGISQVTVLGTLAQTIHSIESQQSLLSLPLFIVVAQIIGLALLFVSAMSGLLVETQSQDIATLKSRGASAIQLLSTFLFQGVAVSLVALIIGPVFAGALSVALVRWFVPSSTLVGAGMSADYAAQFQQPVRILLPGLIGAALGVAVIALAALRSSRMDVLAFRREQGRASRIPFWKRYYIDLALVMLCFAGYLELNQFGSATSRLTVGVSDASLLQLATPALLLLAGSLLVLRLLPVAARIGSRTFARRRGLAPLLAFSQVERNPGRYTSMTLLLVLSVGLGLFALAFDASLTRNVTDRTAYAVGADIRTVQTAAEGNARGTDIGNLIARQPGVAAVSAAYRTQASSMLDQGNQTVDILAIDPNTFAAAAGVTSWRNDYAALPLSDLLAQMKEHAISRSSTQATAVWAVVSSQFASEMQLKTGDNFVLQLNDIPFQPQTFTVGAVVRDFPTLYPARAPGSFIVLDSTDLFAVLTAAQGSHGGDTSLIGPNEYWIKTTPTANTSALVRTLASSSFDTQQVLSLAAARLTASSNPTSAGMRGLLLIGAVIAAALAIVGSLVQSMLATQKRALQFAVLRTVGMTNGQLTGILLGEQVVMYLFGLVGGTALGLLLVTATLPFLQFSDMTVDPAKLGTPPYQVALEPGTLLLFYAALVVAFMLALAIAARHATKLGLGRALRVGED